MFTRFTEATLERSCVVCERVFSYMQNLYSIGYQCLTSFCKLMLSEIWPRYKFSPKKMKLQQIRACMTAVRKAPEARSGFPQATGITSCHGVPVPFLPCPDAQGGEFKLTSWIVPISGPYRLCFLRYQLWLSSWCCLASQEWASVYVSLLLYQTV